MKSNSPAIGSERFHALDALRAFALLLGIAFHATISFLPGMGNLGWPIVDNAPSNELSVIFFVIHIFRMTLFFVIAGFFAHLLFHRQGVARFLKERSKRILAPLIVGWLLLTPLIVASLIFASKKSGIPLPPPPSTETTLAFPFSHLWFLWFLFLTYLVAITGHAIFIRLFGEASRYQHHVDRILKWLTCSGIGPVFLGLPIAISLYFHEAWQLWGGIPTPDKSLIPNLPATLAYGIAFGFGWLLHRQTQLLDTLKTNWVGYLLFAVGLTILCIYLVGASPATSAGGVIGAKRILYAGAYGIAVWCWTFGLFGAAITFLSAPSPAIRYLSDASYWLYLAHLPLIFALQGMVMQWHFHWALKYLLILFISVSLLMLSYQYLVRSTWVGAVLNGRRFPKAVQSNVPLNSTKA